MITQEELKNILQYDPNTGKFLTAAGSKIGYLDSLGYVRIYFQGKAHYAHRLAWMYVYGYIPEKGIDHKDGQKSNNKIDNLREATQSQNMQNVSVVRKDNKLQLPGVSKNHDRFFARINLNKRTIYLGTFDTPEEAHEAYLFAKKTLHPYRPEPK